MIRGCRERSRFKNDEVVDHNPRSWSTAVYWCHATIAGPWCYRGRRRAGPVRGERVPDKTGVRVGTVCYPVVVEIFCKVAVGVPHRSCGTDRSSGSYRVNKSKNTRKSNTGAIVFAQEEREADLAHIGTGT